MLKPPTSPAELPEHIPLFPLSGALLLPFSHRPLNIFEPRYLQMVDDALAGIAARQCLRRKSDVELAPGRKTERE